MFGLMRSCGCGTSSEAKRLRQLHYCGTCKATGRLFGQRARLTLNHDAVFLGELLLALEQVALPTSFTARRCFSLPMAAEIPAPLAYAAAANVALAELAITDKLADNEGLRWKVAQRELSRAFVGARARLRLTGLPLERLFAQSAAQAQVEASPTTLAALAGPTGTATALVFGHGNPAHAPLLTELGEAFGRLIYTLDALTDRDNDLKRGAFNALTATKTSLEQALAYVREQQARVMAALAALPLPVPDRQRFTLQLQASVSRALMSVSAPEQTETNEERITRHYPQRQRHRQTRSCCQCDGCTCYDCTCCCDTTCCNASGDLCTGCHGCHGCHGCEGACCETGCCHGCDCGCSSCC
jgi:Family of unknown function (DUF5685)